MNLSEIRTDTEPLVPTVFVVAQDDAVRALLENLIESARLTAMPWSSHHTFVEHVGPDARGCVLLDIDVPGMSGLQLAERLAAEHPHLSIILLSGRGDLISAARAKPGFAMGIFAKPFDVCALLSCVRRTLARQRSTSPG